MSLSNPGGSSSNLLSHRYRILTVLGDGGFGKTYLVEDTQMPSGRKCVLKQLKPVDEDPQILQIVRERFQREAAILEQLGEHHRQIPRLYAYFSEGEEYYLVEEWIEGETLSQKVQRQGALSEADVRSLLRDLLPTISDIHQQRIVHRDIKPDNIILRQSDQKPVLIDFGAVKEAMSTILNSQGKSTHSIVIGTPGYMPPEQLAGRPVFSSDLYSLGFTAIYLLTGKQPQEFESDPMTGQVLWRQYAPNVTPGFAAILDRAIQTYANHRFATAQDMASALGATSVSTAATVPPTSVIPASSDEGATVAIASSSSTVTTPSSTGSSQPSGWTWQWALIGMGVASLAGISGVLAYRSSLHPSPSPSPSTTASTPASNALTSESPSPSVSPSPVQSPAGQQEPTPTKVSPSPEPPAKSEPSSQPAKVPEASAHSTCEYVTGTAVGGETLTLDLCSIQASQTGTVRFVYALDDEQIESEADCSNGTWITFPEQKVNRPQSSATQAMLEKVCAQQSAPSSISKAGVATVFKPPSNVRVSPNGAILCSVRQKQDINVYDMKGNWYTTDVCGTPGYIHASQLKF